MKHILTFCLLAGIFAFSAQARWTKQTLSLVPGWNTIYLELQPDQPACSNIFAGLPVESVWAWNKTFSSVQFIQDPITILPKQPEWLTWFPASHPQSFLNSMSTLRGAQAYIVKIADDAPPVSLTVSGRPVLPRKSWYPNSFNLVGFYIDPQAKPSFKNFLAPDKALRNQPVFALQPEGHWSQVTDLSATLIDPGKAYWIKCSGPSEYTGPLSINNVFQDGVDFDEFRTEAAVIIKNHASSPRTLSFRRLAPDASPDALPVPLSYWNADFERRRFMWDSLPETLSRPFDASEQWTLRLVVRRADMPSSEATALFQSLIEITDGAGSRLVLPLSAKTLSASSADGSSPLPRSGLWVGRVLLDKVSQVNISDTPAPTPAPLAFRLIIHQDSSGTARLLQHVTIMKNVSGGTTNLVLVTNDKLLSQFGGTDPTADDERVGQRFSSVVFGFDQPLTLTYNQGTRTLSRSVSIGYNDALNPFKHLYHPDHNNLDNYQTPLPEGVQSFDVSRNLSMIISTNIVDGASAAAWGDTVTGGTYKEKLQGLHHKPLYVQGSFILQFVAAIDDLYSGQ